MVSKEVQRCARCGSCTVVCPVFRASGGKEFYSGRGKKYLLEITGEDAPSPVFEDIFSKCLLCGACVKACPRGVDIPEEVRCARAEFGRIYGEYGYRKFLARKVLEHPELLSVVRTVGSSFATLLAKRLPRESGLRLQLAMFDEHSEHRSEGTTEVRKKGSASSDQLIYFPGCSASHLYPEIVASTRRLFAQFGYDLVIPDGLGCCGVAMDAAGDPQAACKRARNNMEILERHEGKILVSCGSCYAHLHRYAELLADDVNYSNRVENFVDRLVEITQFLYTKLQKDPDISANVPALTRGSAKKIRVFYHDPCHLRHELNITREPRQLLAMFADIELVELEDGPQCCGQGGLFHLGAPELSATIRDDLARKVLELEPDIITSTCSGCLMQWKTALAAFQQHDIPVLHLAQLLDGQTCQSRPV